MRNGRIPGGESRLTAFAAFAALAAAFVLVAGVACGDVQVAGGQDGVVAEDGGGGDGAPVSCADYCATVVASCGVAASFSPYPSRSACEAYCETWAGLPLGTDADRGVNTAGCRFYHATVAEQVAPATHCEHAGPTGGDECGSWCDNYCHLALRNCTGANALFGSREECLRVCESFPSDAAVGAGEGDSVQCRIFHLGIAGTEPPASADESCPAGGPEGGGVCGAGDLCGEYCELNHAVCARAGFGQYPGVAECRAYCEGAAGLPSGQEGDTSGNSVECRLYHTRVAETTDPALHCDHAGPTGGNVCGSFCENYCHLAQRNCRGEDALFGSSAECIRSCVVWMEETAVAGGDPEDGLRCRIEQLGAAGSEKEGSAANHCPAGALEGPGPCL